MIFGCAGGKVDCPHVQTISPRAKTTTRTTMCVLTRRLVRQGHMRSNQVVKVTSTSLLMALQRSNTVFVPMFIPLGVVPTPCASDEKTCAELSWDPGCPTIGSRGHLTGCCKPCRFFHKEEGCRWGWQCKFCHRCGPHEKALRKRSERWISKLQNRVDTELVQEILDALESQVSSKESGLTVSL